VGPADFIMMSMKGGAFPPPAARADDGAWQDPGAIWARKETDRHKPVRQKTYSNPVGTGLSSLSSFMPDRFAIVSMSVAKSFSR
jgi:hypothetical protein